MCKEDSDMFGQEKIGPILTSDEGLTSLTHHNGEKCANGGNSKQTSMKR